MGLYHSAVSSVLPWSLDSAWTNSSSRASIRSASLFSTLDLSAGLFADQLGKASLAALTAASTYKQWEKD